MNADKKVRIGVVGCGSISQFAHLPALAKADHIELVALCEACEDLLKTMGERYGVRHLFTDYTYFLSKAEIDAVILAVADRLHVPLTMQALKAGKHVLVEKPLGVNIEECEKLTEIVKGTGKVVQVGSMKRHDPGIEYAQRFITEKMGQRLSINAWYCDSYYRYQWQHTLLPPLIEAKKPLHPQSEAKEDREKYYMITHGIHVIDTIQYLGGQIVAIQAIVKKKFDCYSWHCLVEFGDGAVGHLELTVHVKSDWREGFVVHGEYGTVEGQTFLPFFRRSSEVRIFDFRKGEYQTLITADSDPYERQIESFARAILNGEPVNPGVKDGLADVKVMEAIELSVCSGKRVEVT